MRKHHLATGRVMCEGQTDEMPPPMRGDYRRVELDNASVRCGGMHEGLDGASNTLYRGG